MVRRSPRPSRASDSGQGAQQKVTGADGSPTVLVVDDEDSIRDFLRSALEAEGYTVLAAGDGLDALSLCERYAVDVILLDLMMPRLDGPGFLGRYWQRHGQDGAAVYVMSAVRRAVDYAVAAGVAGAFAKPFDLDDLLDTVAAEVARRRAVARLSESLTPAALRTRRAPARSADRLR